MKLLHFKGYLRVMRILVINQIVDAQCSDNANGDITVLLKKIPPWLNQLNFVLQSNRFTVPIGPSIKHVCSMILEDFVPPPLPAWHFYTFKLYSLFPVATPTQTSSLPFLWHNLWTTPVIGLPLIPTVSTLESHFQTRRTFCPDQWIYCYL
jgi:hypothetical protein